MFRTSVVENNQDPIWNCEKAVEWDGRGEMVFEVWDEDWAKSDDYIGTLAFSAEEILAGIDREFPLLNDQHGHFRRVTPRSMQGHKAPTMLGQDGQRSMLHVRIWPQPVGGMGGSPGGGMGPGGGFSVAASDSYSTPSCGSPWSSFSMAAGDSYSTPSRGSPWSVRSFDTPGTGMVENESDSTNSENDWWSRRKRVSNRGDARQALKTPPQCSRQGWW